MDWFFFIFILVFPLIPLLSAFLRRNAHKMHQYALTIIFVVIVGISFAAGAVVVQKYGLDTWIHSERDVAQSKMGLSSP